MEGNGSGQYDLVGFGNQSVDEYIRTFIGPAQTGKGLVIEGIMIARDWHFYPFLIEIGLQPFRPAELLLGITDQPNHVIDITQTFKKKIRAISMHKSQLGQLPDWRKRILSRVKRDGALAGYKYGEGFYKMHV